MENSLSAVSGRCSHLPASNESMCMQGVLSKAHQSCEQRQSSAWMGALPQPAWGDADAIEAAIMACVERCTDGWVTVVAPVLRLATELISTHTKKSSTFALAFLGTAQPHSLPPCLPHLRDAP